MPSLGTFCHNTFWDQQQQQQKSLFALLSSFLCIREVRSHNPVTGHSAFEMVWSAFINSSGNSKIFFFSPPLIISPPLSQPVYPRFFPSFNSCSTIGLCHLSGRHTFVPQWSIGISEAESQTPRQRRERLCMTCLVHLSQKVGSYLSQRAGTKTNSKMKNWEAWWQTICSLQPDVNKQLKSPGSDNRNQTTYSAAYLERNALKLRWVVRDQAFIAFWGTGRHYTPIVL